MPLNQPIVSHIIESLDDYHAAQYQYLLQLTVNTHPSNFNMGHSLNLATNCPKIALVFAVEHITLVAMKNALKSTYHVNIGAHIF